MQSLFLVTLGPVQDFIASARRTRDLHFGSWFLSEISRAAAYEIGVQQHEILIFPRQKTWSCWIESAFRTRYNPKRCLFRFPYVGQFRRSTHIYSFEKES